MEKNVKNSPSIVTSTEAPSALSPELFITFFTDPLCCWSWGMQPQLDALKDLLGERMTIKYIMCGMLPSWENFHDEVNSVSRPVQMGPVWMHAAQLTGRSINYHIWMKNPPASSYPACIAVKSAHLQSPELGIIYFHRVQEAVMMLEENISSWPVLKRIAKQIALEDCRFDISRFIDDYEKGNGTAAFREDLNLASRYNVGRFPSLLIESPGKKAIIMSGYRRAESITEAMTQAF